MTKKLQLLPLCTTDWWANCVTRGSDGVSPSAKWSISCHLPVSVIIFPLAENGLPSKISFLQSISLVDPFTYTWADLGRVSSQTDPMKNKLKWGLVQWIEIHPKEKKRVYF